MPVVRVAGRQVGTAPLPGVRRTAAETALSQGAGLAEEQARTAERIAAMGGTVARLGIERYGALVRAKYEQEMETRLLSRDRELAEFEVQRLYDPQTGVFATVQGEAAGELLPKLTAEFDELTGQLERGLSDAEKVAFRRIRDRRRERLRESVATYADRELVAHRQRESEASVALALQHAVQNADNPQRVGEELQRTEAILAGLPGLGAQARAALTARAKTAIHAGVIESLLARGADRKAQVYFEEYRDQLVGPVIPELEGQLETASTLGAAQRAADAIWIGHGPKSEADPIQLDVMEDAARRGLGEDPKLLDATIRSLRERKAGVDASRREREEAIAGGLWRAASAGASLEQIRRMPEYIAAPGRVQAQLADYIVNRAEREASRAYSEEGRAFTRAQRVEHEKEQRGWARYWELANPAVLSTLSDDAIEAKRGDLGDTHTNELHKLKRKLDTDDKVREATIDDTLFKSLAESAGLQPYKGTQTDQEKARLGYLRNAVEAAIDREQAARNRPLTRDEKAALMQGELDRQVMVDRWGGGRRTAAMVVHEKDRDAAYVPLAEIPERQLTEAVNLIRSEFPRELRASREDILRRYRDRIQRAYAAAVLGLGPDEERRRLQGR